MQADRENRIGTASRHERSKGNSVSISNFLQESDISIWKGRVSKRGGGMFSVKTDKQGNKLINQLGNRLPTQRRDSDNFCLFVCLNEGLTHNERSGLGSREKGSVLVRVLFMRSELQANIRS